MKTSSFSCPECGSSMKGAPIPLTPETATAPAWQTVKLGVRCPTCRFVIPLHLAQRDDQMTDPRAEHEWAANYRATAPSTHPA